jgi:hypothetical protein
MLAPYRRWRALGVACAISLVGASALVLATGGVGQAARSASWVVQKNFGPGAAVSVAATSSRDVWLTCLCANHGQTPSIERWDGSHWHAVATPSKMFTGQGALIGASSSGDAWVFTQVEPATGSPYDLAWHWTGRTWRRYRLPGRPSVISAAAVLGPTDAWAYGGSYGDSLDLTSVYIVRFTGRGWRRVSAPVIPLTVSARSADDMWIAGPTPSSASRERPDFALARWTGHGWQAVPVPQLRVGTGATLQDPEVLALGPRDVWLTLVAAPNSGVGSSTVIVLHYDGRTWSRRAGLVVPLMSTSNLAPDGHGGLWLALMTYRKGEGELVHFRNDRWSRPVVLARPEHYTVIQALAAWPGSTAPWAVGWTGHLVGDPDPQAVVYSYER